MTKMKGLSFEFYREDINRYRAEFEKTIKEIYQLISLDIDIQKIEARIKSYQSFRNNLYIDHDNIDNKKHRKKTKFKNLNDCFGIKIMLQDDNAILRVIEKLTASGYVIRSVKDHKEIPNTNYNAVHVVAEFKGTTIPFELQLRTEERAKGRLPHDLYKMFGAKKDITYNDRIQVIGEFIKLARLKMDGQYRALIEKLPICYKIEDVKDGEIRDIRLINLSPKEVLRNLYPTVEKMLGEKVFLNILDKIFPKGIQERRDSIPENDKKMLNILFDFILEKTTRRINQNDIDLATYFETETK